MDKLIIVLAALLILWALWQTIRRFQGKTKSSCCGSREAVSVRKADDTDASHYPYRYRLTVVGMMCSHCAVRVENALNAMPGVWGRVDLGKKQADVLTKAPVEEARFAAVLRDASYTLAGYADLSESK